MSVRPLTVILRQSASVQCLIGAHRFMAKDIQSVTVPAGTPHALVEVRSNVNEPLGWGLFSREALLVLHLCQRRKDPIPDLPTYLAATLEKAVRARAELGFDAPDAGVRLVQGEGDGLPGLVVDRYSGCLVCQTSSAVMEHYLPSTIASTLAEITGAETIVVRNERNRLRSAEHLPLQATVLRGPPDPGPIEICEDGVRHIVDPLFGQKTGFYLDQRRARQRVRELARGRRVLDLYSYQAALGVTALRGGATAALAVDSSKEALQLAKTTADLNGVGPQLRVLQKDALPALVSLQDAHETFDLIIIDPPRLTNKRDGLEAATILLQRLHRKALPLLAPGGLLLTCSCTSEITLSVLRGVLAKAAGKATVALQELEHWGLPPDHPVLAGPHANRMEYLTAVLLRRLP